MADPRLYQIATLASLLVYGMGWLDFDITVAARGAAAGDRPRHAGGRATGSTGRAGQLRRARSSPASRSACCCAPTDPSWRCWPAVVTIASKFVIRFRGKHVFNPTNGGLVAMLLLTDQVWVSPGQWGSVAFFALPDGVRSAASSSTAPSRSDVTFAFIACYCALIFGRSLYLGEPLTIPLHRLQSGALLLFTFFMISDPKTTPDSRAGRVLFAALVAFGAWYVQFRLFRTNGLLWSLAAVLAGRAAHRPAAARRRAMPGPRRPPRLPRHTGRS